MTAASAGRGQGLSNGQEGVSFATRDWDAAERAGASMQPCCWLSTWYSHEWVAWAQQPNAIRPKGGFETNITSEQTGIMAGRLPDEACDRRAHLPPPPPPRPPPPPPQRLLPPPMPPKPDMPSRAGGTIWPASRITRQSSLAYFPSCRPQSSPAQVSSTYSQEPCSLMAEAAAGDSPS